MTHEHQRPDRDTKLALSGVCTHQAYDKKPVLVSNTFGLPYDYCSITHYPASTNFGNTTCTITPLENVDCNIKGQQIQEVGQLVGLSALDKETIRRRYNCRG